MTLHDQGFLPSEMDTHGHMRVIVPEISRHDNSAKPPSFPVPISSQVHLPPPVEASIMTSVPQMSSV